MMYMTKTKLPFVFISPNQAGLANALEIVKVYPKKITTITLRDIKTIHRPSVSGLFVTHLPPDTHFYRTTEVGPSCKELTLSHSLSYLEGQWIERPRLSAECVLFLGQLEAAFGDILQGFRL